VRIKGKHYAGQTHSSGPFFYLQDKLLVTYVHTVKIAYGQGTALDVFCNQVYIIYNHYCEQIPGLRFISWYQFSVFHVAGGLTLPCLPKKALNRYEILCLWSLIFSFKSVPEEQVPLSHK